MQIDINCETQSLKKKCPKHDRPDKSSHPKVIAVEIVHDQTQGLSIQDSEATRNLRPTSQSLWQNVLDKK